MVKYLVVSMVAIMSFSAFAEGAYNRAAPLAITVTAPVAGATLADGAQIMVNWSALPAGTTFDRFVLLTGNAGQPGSFFLNPFQPITDKTAVTATATINSAQMMGMFTGNPTTGFFIEVRAEILTGGVPTGEAAVGDSGTFTITPPAGGGTTPPPAAGSVSVLGPVGPADVQSNSTGQFGLVLHGLTTLDGIKVEIDWGDGNSGVSGFSQSTRDANGDWHVTRDHTYRLTPNVMNQPNEASYAIAWTLTFPSGQIVKYTTPVHVVQPARFILLINSNLKYNPTQDSSNLPTIPGYQVIVTMNKKTGIMTGIKFKKLP